MKDRNGYGSITIVGAGLVPAHDTMGARDGGTGHGATTRVAPTVPVPQRKRRSIRLQGYDYTQPGAYFITICTQDRACLFGKVADGQMQLNDAGKTAEQCWQEIPSHFPTVVLDVFVVMPNHLHGIVVLNDYVGATHASPLQRNNASPVQNGVSPGRPRGPQGRSIASIIGSFKSAVTKRINEIRMTPGASVWQRNYYEHIIRDDESLNRIREYIANNPLQWEFDRENPGFTGPMHDIVGAQVGAQRCCASYKDEPWRI
jgi:REP element-mobilizing transposase RayT